MTEPAELETDPAVDAGDPPPEGADAPEAAADGKQAAEATGEKATKAAPPKPRFKPPPPEDLEGAIEALVLAAGDVIRAERLRDLLGLPSVKPVREALETIRARWEEIGMVVELEAVGGGYRVVTRPTYAEYVSRLSRRPTSDKLSRTLLETLCIVAYKQPVGRAEVERIRGVQCGESLRGLLERRLIKVVGRSDQPGRPLLYGTTQRFLTAFGLMDLKDLPSASDLQRL